MKIKFMTQNWGEVPEVCLDLKKERKNNDNE